MAAPTAAAAASGGRIPRDLRPGGRFDRYLGDLAERDQFSGVVLLAHRDRPVLERAYGLANRARRVPNHAGTRFNVASVTKSLTGIAVMQLVERGDLGLDAPVGSYLDGFPPYIADVVTVHQLLTHTGGMGGYSRTDRFREGLAAWASEAEVMAGILDIIRDAPLEAVPGTEHIYSDSGYAVLGAIVAAVAGGPSYYDEVREHVMAASRMTRSGFFSEPEVLAADDIAHPHTTDPESGLRIDFTTSEFFGFVGGPADGAYCTAADLLRFAAALRDGDLLSSAFTSLTTSAKVPVPPAKAPPAWADHQFYGYGFRVAIAGGQLLFGHSGTGAGNRANIDIFPDLNWVTVTLSNYAEPITDIVRLQRQLVTRQ
ncbi:serine hydrolase domain-containing protein [Jiangella gansuensis]|uniref:serine hydrolase domain-containing protein n=1 Tax=Jiangella gansuensis TaxID=281473 RepID=UPI001B7FCB6B|nr:serine hydrolase domain-containing protein [Jiangella gansuensis]